MLKNKHIIFFSGCIKIFLIALYFVYNVLWFQKNMLVFGFNLKLAQKYMDFLIVLLQKLETNMVFILSKHKKCPTVLKLNKKVQEPAAESCMTILFLKISVLLKTKKLISSTIINKFLVLFIILPNIEEKQIRNLNTQNMTSSLKKL